MQDTLTPDHVQAALTALGLGITIMFFDTPTATSEQAAANIGCELGQIAKSIAFLADGRPLLIVASGDQRVDEKKLAALTEVSRKRIKIATPEQCVDIYGYAPGGVPPVALRTADLPIYIDDALCRYETVYAAAGAPNAIFPIALDQLVAATGGTVADVRRE